MPGTLADRIRAERQRQFVGRREELQLFEDVLTAPELPVVVLSIHGPGGVGKTTLLRQLESCTDRLGVHRVTLDTRVIQPNPEAFLGMLCMVTGTTDPQSAFSSLSKNGRGVLFLDTVEAIEPLDGWIRESLVPGLPSDILVVMLGRKRPSPEWRSDVWAQLCRAVPLRNLGALDARAYLDAHRLPPDQHERIVAITHGYPLALSLVAEQYAQTGILTLGDEPSPDIVAILLERFLESVREPEQREVLELCALVRITTEAIVNETMGQDKGPALFAWLRSLSFIEMTPFGLMPHDLARDAIGAELKWRNTDRYSTLHHRARAYYSDRLDRATGALQQAILFDYIYLHRDNPVVKPFFQWHSHAASFIDGARPTDLPEIVRITSRHEGEESVRWVKHWFDRQPSEFVVLRSGTSTNLHGFFAKIDISNLATEDLEDPACRACLHYLETHAQIRPGERATLFRFWMADDGYQSVSPDQSLLFITFVQHYLTEPGLAVTFLPCAEPEFWAPMFEYSVHDRTPDLDYSVGQQKFGVFMRDWRLLPPKPWLALLSEREVPMKEAPQSMRPTQDLVVLSRESFDAAILDALRRYSNDGELSRSPLLRSRVVIERLPAEADAKERLRILRGILQEASNSLTTNAKDAKLYRTMETSYLKPLRSQEVAAEKLDVSIATYRRHLRAAEERICDLLWQQETGL